MRIVDVYYNDIKAGILTEENPGKNYTFTYDDDYLATDNPPVSLTISKKIKEYHSPYLFPFFSNMLPEGRNREVYCRLFKLDADDEFGLLLNLADGDFIGAVNIRTHNPSPQA